MSLSGFGHASLPARCVGQPHGLAGAQPGIATRPGADPPRSPTGCSAHVIAQRCSERLDAGRLADHQFSRQEQYLGWEIARFDPLLQ